MERPSPRERSDVHLRVCGVPGATAIYLAKSLLDEITAYGGGDLKRPRGGFLAGAHGEGKGERYVEILHHLPATAGVGKGVEFRFTKQSYSDAVERLKTLGPDVSLVGWYTTHLGSGIFLSGGDLEIQRMFFNRDWMIALVLDPTQGNLGFFQWKGKTLVPSGFILVEPA